MKRKVVIISVSIILTICIVGVLYNYFFSKKATVYNWRSSIIEKGEISLIVTATGIISADTTVAIGTQVTGVLSKLFVDFNSKVKKGQIIAQIDTTILHAARIDAEANFERAQAQFNGYNRDFDRQKKLFESKIISQSDYDLSLTNYETSLSNVKSFKAQLERAIINLRNATIRSPINGIVISRNLDEGQTVIASFNTPTLFTIVNSLKTMQVQANVSEADIGEVKVGQGVDFTVDAYPNDVFTGHIQQIRLQPITVQNVVNYIVVIDAINSNLKLMPGLTANININVNQRSNVFKVPANAISFIPPIEYINDNLNLPDSIKKIWLSQTDNKLSAAMVKKDDANYLWVINGIDIYPVKIKKGLSDGILTEVDGNVKVGQKVVTGINHSASPKDEKKADNPFLPKFPSRNRRL